MGRPTDITFLHGRRPALLGGPPYPRGPVLGTSGSSALGHAGSVPAGWATTVGERARRVEAQLASLKTGLVGLQRSLREAQAQVLHAHVHALLAPPPAASNVAARLDSSSSSSSSSNSSSSNAGSGTAPGRPRPWTAARVLDRLFDPALSPAQRLAVASAGSLLVRGRRRLDPDATESSSGDSATDEDASEDDEADDRGGELGEMQVRPLQSARGGDARGGHRRIVVDPRRPTLASLRAVAARDRRGVAWRRQWLRMQLLDLDARLAAAVPALATAGPSFAPHAHASVSASAATPGPAPVPALTPASATAPAATAATVAAAAAAAAAAATAAVPGEDDLVGASAARVRVVPSAVATSASGGRPKRPRVVTRRPPVPTLPSLPTPFYHPFLSFPHGTWQRPHPVCVCMCVRVCVQGPFP
jgi:hypothetical protein